MKNVLILAAGKSTRFGRDKLDEQFCGKTLPQLAAEFAIRNGAENIYLTVSKSAIRTDGHKVYHPIVDAVSRECDPLIRFQDDASYGPGAAIAAWSGIIEDEFTVLFGDNYYGGTLSRVSNVALEPGTTMFTYQSRPKADPRNLQLAAVIDGYIVEKPHAILKGDFFCGFVRFSAGFLSSAKFRKSGRGEVEITDMVNMSGATIPVPLFSTGITWGDLTYESDVPSLACTIEDARK